ncbi:MAG: tripartite tricarboxylate transporter TctB family protein [Propionibacteriales bacterium]|nr:tripartite tricarboxylate transporter TctB family protein [Propionibacteriales bacterium]
MATAGRRRPFVPDLLAGGVFVLLGLAFAIGGARYDVGSALRMGPGYVPLLLGGILTVLGLVIIAQAFLGGDQPARELADQERAPVPWWRAALLVAGVLYFGATVRGMGLAPTLFVMTFLVALAGHRSGVVRALITAAGLTVLCLVVFVYLLQLRLPLFGTWLGR